MRRMLHACLIVSLLNLTAAVARAEFPTPSPYPIAWEFDFSSGTPTRIVVDDPATGVPQAYWYITYTVTNNTDQERMFLPVFEMLTEQGRVVRSDRNVPLEVFEVIKQREGRRFLEHALQIAGELRLGEDQAREGAAIWPEPEPAMRQFSIFVSGLSGETAQIEAGESEITLRKTLRLDYSIRGDRVLPRPQDVIKTAQSWIMR
jgi:hypothetical protein